MIWVMLLYPFELLVNAIVFLLPATPSIGYDISVLVGFIRKGLYFTDSSIFALCVSTFITWQLYLLSWNCIKFVYGKIPILDIH